MAVKYVVDSAYRWFAQWREDSHKFCLSSHVLSSRLRDETQRLKIFVSDRSTWNGVGSGKFPFRFKEKVSDRAGRLVKGDELFRRIEPEKNLITSDNLLVAF